MNVNEFLQNQGVWFEKVPHRTTGDAQRMAQAVHVSGDEVAKTVVLKAGKRHVLAVLPATHRVDLDKAAEALGEKSVELADEVEFKSLFPDCELGAVPPFGSQYGLPTLVSTRLTRDEEIVFESNTHDEAVRMRYADFEKLEKPQAAHFTHHT